MTKINLNEFKTLIDTQLEKFLILDVRTQSECKEKSIKGSLNIPLQELPVRLDEIKSYTTIAIHCAHGMRAKKAAEILAPNLNCKIYYVDGDIEDWERAGLVVD